MTTTHLVATTAQDIGVETLKQAPVRTLVFLQAMADPAVRKSFTPVGWSEESLGQGWSLIAQLRDASKTEAPESDEAREAIAACERFGQIEIVRARARLAQSSPEQAAFLFDGIEGSKGAVAVLDAITFVQRYHALEKGADRKATRRVDGEALKALESVGVTKVEVKSLEKQIDIVQSAASTGDGAAESKQEEARLDLLRRMHVWVTTWSDLARTVVTRRDHLIRLGIAKRRPKKAKVVMVPPAPIATPTPTPAPADDDHGPASHAA